MTSLLIVMYVLAGTFILIGITGGSGMQLEKLSIPAIPRVARISSTIFGIFFFVIALFFTVVTVFPDLGSSGSPTSPTERSPDRTVTAEPEPGEQSTTPRTQVIFNTPHNGDLVEHKQNIRGTVSGIPPGKYLWIVVRPQSDSRYYPQDGPISVTPDGGFETDAYFGLPSDSSRGDIFSIIVTVTSKEDSDEFARYHHDSELAKEFEGLAKIPGSVARVAELTVTRS